MSDYEEMLQLQQEYEECFDTCPPCKGGGCVHCLGTGLVSNDIAARLANELVSA